MRFPLLLLLIVVFAGSASADLQLTPGNTSAGGQGDGMQIIMGQPLVGQQTIGGQTIRLGFLGSWLGFVSPPIVESLDDNGLIRSTRILKMAETLDSDIQIRFTAEATVTHANIYRLSGVGTEFSSNGGAPDFLNWKLVAQNIPINRDASVDNGDTIWQEASPRVAGLENSIVRVRDGNNAYYRVVPNSVADITSLFSEDPVSRRLYNSITISKVDINLTADRAELITIPVLKYNAAFVQEKNINLVLSSRNVIITGQYCYFLPLFFQCKFHHFPKTGGSRNGFILYNDSGLIRLNCNESVWNSIVEINLGKGYWVTSRENVRLTFVGALVNNYFSPLSRGLGLYGYPLPQNNNQISLGVSPQNGDFILLNEGGLVRYNYSSGSWPAGGFVVPLLKGFWYNNPSSALRYLEIAR